MAPTGKGSEHWHQSTFISIIRKASHPAGRLTFAIPNGFMRTKSMRIRAWKEGLVSGVPDLFNPYPMPGKGYVGQWIEMKAGTNGLSPEQADYKREMEALGYRVDVCRSWNEALRAWADYLDIDVILS
jgi:hypothetical protein